MKYTISDDIKVVCKLLNLSFSELANELGVARSTIIRIVNKEIYPSDLLLEAFYSYAYNNPIRPIRLNKLKIQWAIDQYDKILFHGAKAAIDREIDISHSRGNNDVGDGFYLGESYEQSSSYIFLNNKSSVYIFDASKFNNLKIIEYKVDLKWMLLVSYYRGQLDEYGNCSLLKNIIDESMQADIIIAPIADNNMYETMNQFARGDITDLQAISALSASSLGKQHVLKTRKACESVSIVDRLYLSRFERNDIEDIRKENSLIAMDKSKMSIEKYRRLGKYIEEILK